MDKLKRVTNLVKTHGLNLFCTILVKFVIGSNYTHYYKTMGKTPTFLIRVSVILQKCNQIICYSKYSFFLFSPFFYSYAHFLPDHEFPLLKMKEPSLVNGKYYFPETRIKVCFGKKCMICGKLLKVGPAISGNHQQCLPHSLRYFKIRWHSDAHWKKFETLFCDKLPRHLCKTFQKLFHKKQCIKRFEFVPWCFFTEKRLRNFPLRIRSETDFSQNEASAQHQILEFTPKIQI